MLQTLSLTNYGVRPLLLLTCLFLAWKSLLLVLILASPGPGYDTSTSLLVETEFSEVVPGRLSPILLKLVRWDAIYFTQISDRGRVYEQEWAFGLGLSGIVSLCSKLFQSFVNFEPTLTSTVVAVTVSHICHCLVVLTIFVLVKVMMQDRPDIRDVVAFLAAGLHIMSPAGAFLSTPYSESVFAFLNVSGSLLYMSGLKHDRKGSSITSGVSFVLSGLICAFATVIRSNGVLSGVPFLYDAVLLAWSVFQDGSVNVRRVTKLCSLVLGGLLIAVGFAIPQYVAYSEYCQGRDIRRLWCEATMPSIYTWVQGQYWNVGLFRYWTLSNVPLFLLALPTLSILIYSALALILEWDSVSESGSRGVDSAGQIPFQKECTIRLAIPQVVLAVLALTSYHVQIITRLSSACVLWYVWLARSIHATRGDAKTQNKMMKIENIVRWMVVYAVVQAGLYGSFLPPA